jgi:hypothetical protein
MVNARHHFVLVAFYLINRVFVQLIMPQAEGTDNGQRNLVIFEKMFLVYGVFRNKCHFKVAGDQA